MGDDNILNQGSKDGKREEIKAATTKHAFGHIQNTVKVLFAEKLPFKKQSKYEKA